MIGIIADGPGDVTSLRTRWKGQVRVVKAEGPRGGTVAPDVIARTSIKQMRILHAIGCGTVVLITDREARGDTSSEISRQLATILADMDLPCTVHVAVPDQMIENWYLADLEELSRRRAYIKDGLRQRQFEGKPGKDELKRFFKHGHSYSETHHGPQLFRTIRIEVAEKNSQSFKLLVMLLREAGVAVD